MNSTIFRSINCSVAIVIGVLMLFSCENDPKEVEAINDDVNYPVQSLKNVKVLYSTKGEVTFQLKAPIVNQYRGKEPFNEMPEGVDVEMYDSAKVVTTKLTSNYAIDKEFESTMEAKNDVVVVNEKGEQLNTEHLIWDRKSRKITSDVFVKITTENQILTGDGLVADEDFTNYQILKPKGIINVDDD